MFSYAAIDHQCDDFLFAVKFSNYRFFRFLGEGDNPIDFTFNILQNKVHIRAVYNFDVDNAKIFHSGASDMFNVFDSADSQLDGFNYSIFNLFRSGAGICYRAGNHIQFIFRKDFLLETSSDHYSTYQQYNHQHVGGDMILCHI